MKHLNQNHLRHDAISGARLWVELVAICAILLVANTSLMGQSPKFEEAFHSPALQARTATHDDDPGHSFALIWLNRIRWDSVWQTFYTYSATGELVEEIREQYQGNQYSPASRKLFTYDPAGNLIESIYQVWDIGAWKNAARSLWLRDIHGNDTLSWEFQWQSFAPGYAWDTTNGSRNRIVYTPTGQIAAREQSNWAPGVPSSYWYNASKAEYFFNPQDQWDTLVEWTASGPLWLPSSRIVQVVWADYGLGLKSSWKSQYYTQGNWVNTSRTNCTYAGWDSDCISETYNNGNWDSSYQVIKDYDLQDHLVQTEMMSYSNGNWNLSNGELHLYTYDLSGRTMEQIDQSWDQTVGYINTFKFVYDYTATGLMELGNETLLVTAYPNPATAALHFKTDLRGPVTITLTDLQGRTRVRAQAVATGQDITMPLSETLENGTYIYQWSSRQGVTSGKVVISR